MRLGVFDWIAVLSLYQRLSEADRAMVPDLVDTIDNLYLKAHELALALQAMDSSISPDEIKGTSRKAPIVHARHVAVYVTREITKDSWKHIGSMFGDRDHTSMMHGYQKIADMMRQDKDLNATVRMLMRNLYPEA